MKAKTIFYCTECGNETSRWAGQCPACGRWNTLTEEPAAAKTAPGRSSGAAIQVKKLSEVDTGDEERFSTGIGEFDRVLGGGAVRGSLVLVGGLPGIGKSTLMLQMCGLVDADYKILYASGEESPRQIRIRADRMGVKGEGLYLIASTEIGRITQAAERLTPDILIVDSIQTMQSETSDSSPGSVSQVKECTMALMRLAKDQGITVFVIGHVNKEGAIAGPKVLEHMVDCVLIFESSEFSSFRILRADKNRFGSTNEIGVFEMGDTGLRDVPNPSELLLSGRPENVPGSCVACVMEGSRPVLAEIQALLSTTAFGNARRTTNGVDYNRAMMLFAVLEKRCGLRISGCDAYLNVIGGLTLGDPAADLAAALATVSSYRDQPLGNQVAAVGEVGLTGELRSVTQMNQRLAEVRRLGFDTCVIPRRGSDKLQVPEGLRLIKCNNLHEAIKTFF